MNHDLNIPISITTKQALDVLAIWEGQAGYWETAFRKHEYAEIDGENYMTSVQCKCTDAPGIGIAINRDWWLIDEHTVVEGLKRIIAGRIAACRDELLVLLGSNEIDMVDVDQADAIVQAGLFGELVYG